MANPPLLIIGTGLAGYSVARELRKLSARELVLVSADDGSYYSKPMLSNAYTSAKQPENIAISPAEKMAEQLRASIHTQQLVSAIDPGRQTLALGDLTLSFSDLVLATGADPIKLPIAGNGSDRIYSINDLRDYIGFRAAISAARHVVILGAGLIGCEFANDLSNGGIAVTVVDPGPFPLNRLLPEPAARALQTALAELKVDWRLGSTVQSVETEGTRVRVTLADGGTCTTDAVLSAVGLRPRIALAQQAGLAVNRGIVVNRELETSTPHIFALGDCAEVEGLVLPYVMPIMQAARALAQTLAGNRTPVSYPAMPVVVKTAAHPVVVSPPPQNSEGRWECQETGSGVKALFRDGQNRLLGFALTGSTVAEKNALTKELPAVLA